MRADILYMIYLDYAAATPLDPEVFESMKPWMGIHFSNPSGIYQSAQRARAAVDEARTKVADFLKANPLEIIFTGSGTESCNLALRGVIEDWILKHPGKKPHVITSSIEHNAVLKMVAFLKKLHGISVDYLPVDQEGIIQLGKLSELIRPETILVSIMMVNNEIGTLQPVKEIGQICREKGVLFHSDACQATPYFDLDMKSLPVDLLSINASKMYGPKGIGALYVREGVEITPLIHGGGQEYKRRAGTENVAAIVGLGKAVELLKDTTHREKVRHLRNHLWEELQEKIPGVKLNGSFSLRSPNNLNVYFPGIEGDTLVRKLDLEGICVSTTSACSAGILDPSHVLLALGGGVVQGSIRITLGKYSTEDECDGLVKTLKRVL